MGDPIGIGVGRTLQVLQGGPPAPAPARGAASGPTAARSSTIPEMLALARELAAAGPPVDAAAIARIRQAIAEGSYMVDAGAIASALIERDRIETDVRG